MNIYHVSWDYSGFGLNAVVIATTADEAEKLLDFDYEEVSGISFSVIGMAIDAKKTSVVVEESL